MAEKQTTKPKAAPAKKTAKPEKETSETAAEATIKTAENMTDDNDVVVELPAKVEIENLIKSYVIGSMTVALVPVPAFDAAGIVALQVKMVHGLTKLYGVPFSDKLAQRLILSLIGGVAPVAIGLSAASLAKSIPFVGTAGGTAGMVILAGASTYASGRVLARHLDTGGSLTDVDMGGLRKGFRTEFKRGKQVAAELRDKAIAAVKPEPTAADAEQAT